jgi:hypothetical protein
MLQRLVRIFYLLMPVHRLKMARLTLHGLHQAGALLIERRTPMDTPPTAKATASMMNIR